VNIEKHIVVSGFFMNLSPVEANEESSIAFGTKDVGFSNGKL